MDGGKKYAIFSNTITNNRIFLLSELVDSYDEAKQILIDIKQEYPEAVICIWEEE